MMSPPPLSPEFIVLMYLCLSSNKTVMDTLPGQYKHFYVHVMFISLTVYNNEKESNRGE
jgi:hypothetical protein